MKLKNNNIKKNSLEGFLIKNNYDEKIANCFIKQVSFSDEMRKDLEKTLGLKIKNISVFEQALTHSSFSGMNKEAISNERLEFLGDAVLDFIVSDFLFVKYRDRPEGELTVLRSRLVGKKTLVKIAQKLKLQDFMVISFGMQKNNFDMSSENILSDVTEAIIAAIFIDSGIEAATQFVYKNIISVFSDEELISIDNNYKKQLQELLQAKSLPVPNYKIIEEVGEAHNKDFTVGVFENNILLGVGTGKSKKNAEQKAAQKAIEQLDINKLLKTSS